MKLSVMSLLLKGTFVLNSKLNTTLTLLAMTALMPMTSNIFFVLLIYMLNKLHLGCARLAIDIKQVRLVISNYLEQIIIFVAIHLKMCYKLSSSNCM